MQGLNFIAIDFETATGRRASVCEAGICVVRDGKVVETRLARSPARQLVFLCQYANPWHPSKRYGKFSCFPGSVE